MRNIGVKIGGVFLLLGILLGFYFSTTATADVVDDSHLRTAQSYWNAPLTNVCPTGIHLRKGATGAELRASAATDYEPHAVTESVYSAEQGSDCGLAFVGYSHYNYAFRCSIMVHEYGHLMGEPHNKDPQSIMYSEWLNSVPMCERKHRQLRRKCWAAFDGKDAIRCMRFWGVTRLFL